MCSKNMSAMGLKLVPVAMTRRPSMAFDGLRSPGAPTGCPEDAPGCPGPVLMALDLSWDG